MKILKKMGVLVCTVGILAESPVMNVWAAPETVVMSRILSESPETVNQMAVETAELKIDSEFWQTNKIRRREYAKEELCFMHKYRNYSMYIVISLFKTTRLRCQILRSKFS